ncbi:peptidase domain-containing ABC transporter [Niastella caeni]|uniref:Peptidase domain-containing ABC transporter n=1 Tax=Niastella caeni TaxID=2569763 RepID=A0A4S8HID6_9BACT|nr:peptidase domain-containing ABC transporter [Niastella caeni]THU34978.1 peptidase domain-containing ABC transporter [Niastella caeni]
MLKKFPHYKQHDEMDCGPACLRIICKYYGKSFPLEHLRSLTHTNRTGSSLLALSEAAEKLGLRSVGARISYKDLEECNPLPCIAFWNQHHFIVVYKIKKDRVYVSDPAHGLVEYSKEEFLKGWSLGNEQGIILSLEPSPEFMKMEEGGGNVREKGFAFIFSYLTRYRKELMQILMGLLAGSLLQLIFPFLTQSIVDIGIRHHDMPFIYMILTAQLMVFIGKTTVEMLRGYIVLHLSSRINITLLSDFFIKLMKLPLGFFDTKMIGDILQRIGDHQRVENFLTSGTFTTIFSLLNLVVFSIILAIYSPLIFLVFLAGSACYFVWVISFLKKRAKLDYKRFSQLSANQEKNFELIFGMQEIKLHNAERKKRWQWEHLQVKLFRINLKSLTLKQVQSGGASVINELKNIFISFLAAKLVLQGDMTLGMMLSVSYITGQLNAPITQLVEFIQSLQDARLSMERINEIHNKPDEEAAFVKKIETVPAGDIVIENLSFKYDTDPRMPGILKNINCVIPAKKVTAIVGASGSGKTTLLKLLLKFYEPAAGAIYAGNTAIANIHNSSWRNACGVVMQEGFIFNDTVANNIAVGEENIDRKRLLEAARVANIVEFVDSLPLKFETKIGSNGIGISTGQKQRILIARAIYKNPDILLFDEATSALDTQNERIIMENLQHFFKGKTVIVIAHRLSTVRNADKIVVLDKGELTEVGTHEELITEKGFYFNLIKNQLELGN